MNANIETKILKIEDIKANPMNPKKHWVEKISESIREMGYIEPIVVDENNMILAGHGRLKALKEIGTKEVEVIIKKGLTEEQKTKYMLLSNKIVEAGGWDYSLLEKFEEDILSSAGFSSKDMDEIFGIDETTEMFDLAKELKKLDIQNIQIKKGDVLQLGKNRIMCGDSTIEQNVLKLMDGEKASMCLTDPPYILDYLKGKTKQKDGVTTGFGAKKNRRYLETDVLPDNFTELWMANVTKVQQPDFSIIVFENPKNLRTIWNELEKHWKYRNTITWHLPNRVSGFSAKYKFFNKTDIALVGTRGNVQLNLEPEDELLQNEYESALFATSGKPHWESYKKGKKYCPTDFIEMNAADEKNSGQGIIFGTKPLELLIPYLKVLTKRDDLIVEPFGGSGSTLIAAEKMKRRCYLMEKSPVYAEVIKHRWEKLTGQKAKKL